MISIKFKRCNYGDELVRKIENKEKDFREKSYKVTNEKGYQYYLSQRTQQIMYCYDVKLELAQKEVDFATKKEKEDNKAILLSFYNTLKVYMNNYFNSIKVSKIYRPYSSDVNSGFNQVMSYDELAKLLYVPSIEEMEEFRDEDLPVHYLEQDFYIPKEDEFTEGITIGELKHPFIKNRAIKVPISQFETHWGTFGQSGSGKTSMLHLTLDCRVPILGKKNNGFMMIDPKGVSAIRIINHLLKMEVDGILIDWSKVHYIDLKQGEYVPSINLLHKPAYKTMNEIIDSNLELFKNVYDSGDTPEMDKNLRNIMGALIVGKQGGTMLDAPRMINNTKFRNTVIKNVKGAMYDEIRTYWDNPPKDSNFNSAVNRLSLFQAPTMKRLYGRNEMQFDFVKWANEGHIVIVNALDLSNHATTLLIGQTSKLALEQIINAGKVNGFTLAIDEGKRSQVSALKRITAEGREAGLWLDYYTQDIELLKKDFTKELMGNITNYRIGRHQPSSARTMASLLSGNVDASTIASLPNNTMICKTSNNKGEFVSMKITAPPPYEYMPSGATVEYKNQAQEQIAREWTELKTEELQKRDWMHKDDIDKMLYESNPNLDKDIGEMLDAFEGLNHE